MRTLYVFLLVLLTTLLSAQESKEKEEKAEVLFEKKEKVIVVEEIPDQIFEIAAKGQNVFLQSADNNAAIHAKNIIESWDYWSITPDLNEANFILKFIVRFKGPATYFVKAQFIDPKSNEILYTTQEISSIKDAKEFNKKRSAVNQLFDEVFKDKFK